MTPYRTFQKRLPFWGCVAILLFSFFVYLPPIFANEGVNKTLYPDWATVMNLYQKRAWKHTILELTPNLLNNAVDRGYRIKGWFIHGQSLIALGQNSDARKSFQNAKRLDKKYPDFWDYHIMRTYLREGLQAKAVPFIKKILTPPVNKFYLQNTRINIKRFYSDDETLPLIFPVLEESLKRPSLLLYDSDIIKLYARGAALQEKTFPAVLHVYEWLNPKSLKHAKAMDKKIEKLLDQKAIRIEQAQFIERYKTLRKKGYINYVTQIIPHQISYVTDNFARSQVGGTYLRALFQQKSYSKIVELYKTNVLTKKYNAVKTTQLFWSARSLQRLKKLNEAEKIIGLLEKTYSQSTWLPPVYLKMAETYEIHDNHEKENEWLRKVVKRYAGSKEAEKAFWQLAWNRYQAQRYKDSLYYINQALKKQKLTPEVLAKFHYWKGKNEYLLGNHQQADKTFQYLQKTWPNTYYTFRFLSQPGDWVRAISTYGVNAPHKSFWHDTPPKPKGNVAQILQRHEFLFSVGEDDQAIMEVQRDIWRQHRKREKAMIWRDSELLYENGAHHPLQSLISNYYLYDLKKLPMGDHQLWKFAYPRPYWTFIKQRSQKANIDPYWVLAIMREESRFDPEAYSSAKAHGLMQFIEPTAKEVAKELKIKLNGVKSLFIPNINIRLGAHYLGKLSKEFGDELAYVASGYNAGPHRIRKWLAETDNLPLDEFVETIPFTETRNYVKRVFMTYTLYKSIYEKQGFTM